MAGEQSFRSVTPHIKGGVFAGLFYPFRALRIIHRTPGLWRYILIPIGINILVGITFYIGLLLAGLRAIDTLVSNMTGLEAIFAVFLQVFLVVGLLIITGFLLVRFGVVLGSPWYSQLSERLEQIYAGQSSPPVPAGMRAIAIDIARSLLFELKKLLLVLLIALLLFLCNLLPLVGQLLTMVGGIGLGALIACLDFLDPPLERRRLKFRAKLNVIRRSLPASASFGLICFGLVSIPFLNLLSIPLCITAGTLFFCDHVRLVR